MVANVCKCYTVFYTINYTYRTMLYSITVFNYCSKNPLITVEPVPQYSLPGHHVSNVFRCQLDEMASCP